MNLSPDSNVLDTEDIQLGVAGGMLNDGPEHKNCTGEFECAGLNVHEVIRATSIYMIEYILNHFNYFSNLI